MRAVLRQLSDGGAAVISARGGLRGRVHGDFLREAEVPLRSISVTQHNAEVSLRIPGCVDPLSSQAGGLLGTFATDQRHGTHLDSSGPVEPRRSWHAASWRGWTSRHRAVRVITMRSRSRVGLAV